MMQTREREKQSNNEFQEKDSTETTDLDLEKIHTRQIMVSQNVKLSSRNMCPEGNALRSKVSEDMEFSTAKPLRPVNVFIHPEAEHRSTKRKSFISGVESPVQNSNHTVRRFAQARRISTPMHEREHRLAGEGNLLLRGSSECVSRTVRNEEMKMEVQRLNSDVCHSSTEFDSTTCFSRSSDKFVHYGTCVNESLSNDQSQDSIATDQDTPETDEMHGLERVSEHALDLGELTEKLHQLQLQTGRNKRRPEKHTERNFWHQIDRTLHTMPAGKLRDLFEAQDDDGDTLLMIAIIEGCTTLAKSLIRVVPSPELLTTRNKLGQTALHLAVITRQGKIIRRLVLAGANVTSRDFVGNTALHIACGNNDLDSAIALTKTITCLECPDKIKRESLSIPQASELYNFKGQTCLHIAAEKGFTRLVQYLVETRFAADVNAPERLGGKTAFHLASELGRLDLVEYFLSLEQTDVHAVTYAGLTARDLAEGRVHGAVVKVLDAAGVKPSHIAEEVTFH